MKKLLLVFLGLLIIQSSYAAVVGVSPSIMRFSGMSRGGYAQSSMLISTDSSVPVTADFDVTGDIREWVTITPAAQEFNFSSGAPHAATVIIQPPIDTPTGNYTGKILVTTQNLQSVSQGAGSAIVAQIGQLIFIEVIGDEVIDCRAGAVVTSNTEVDEPFIVQAIITNDGNVRLRPEIQVDVYDQYQVTRLQSSTFFGDQVLPTTQKTIIDQIEHNLDEGQYFAHIILRECGVEQWTTFDVVEEGGISDNGVFMGMRLNEVSYQNQPMMIAPIFRNTGPRTVLAQFKGEVRDQSNDKLLAVLESDKLEVTPGATQELNVFYTPKDHGEIRISGRVVYNNKITFDEQSRSVQVLRTQSSSLSWVFYIIAYLIIGLLIMIMISKIKRAKRRKF